MVAGGEGATRSGSAELLFNGVALAKADGDKLVDHAFASAVAVQPRLPRQDEVGLRVLGEAGLPRGASNGVDHAGADFSRFKLTNANLDTGAEQNDKIIYWA